MDWTDETIDRLKGLWAEGLSTAEIGRRLNISKNAVVGKAHRLDLPARPSPIRREVGGMRPRSPAPRRVSGPTLPALASLSVSAQTATPSPVRPVMPSVARPSLVGSGVSRTAPRTPACCWPIGEPGTSSFRFCGEPSLGGKPYCGAHAEIAYVRVRDRREDVA
ncbi:MAG TPA: GcrA family cell cycle regulator [Acidiphilium sp.]